MRFLREWAEIAKSGALKGARCPLR
jgi:hypothetical protein